MPAVKKGVEIKITGLVQGVLFRQEAKRIAQGLELTGWVKNESDGTVLVTAEGEESSLQKLTEWCRKGTKWSRVDTVAAEWKEPRNEFDEFSIK